MLSFGFHRSPLLCAFVRLCLLCILFELCLYLWPIACFCKNLMLNISFGCCRHSVSNTIVQLTEGRSARDQPKQPPAKKNGPAVGWPCGLQFFLFPTPCQPHTLNFGSISIPLIPGPVHIGPPLVSPLFTKSSPLFYNFDYLTLFSNQTVRACPYRAASKRFFIHIYCTASGACPYRTASGFHS